MKILSGIISLQTLYRADEQQISSRLRNIKNSRGLFKICEVCRLLGCDAV
jgi:hypothetical protein